ncbi:MAG: extracellular matrix regulator RemB [Acutalibacteraceae bacterium]
MYIHLGEETVINEKDIIGIFDLDNTTVSKSTRDFLSKSTKDNLVVNVSYELPKSFVLAKEKGKTKVYINQISSKTLIKRKNSIL